MAKEIKIVKNIGKRKEIILLTLLRWHMKGS